MNLLAWLPGAWKTGAWKDGAWLGADAPFEPVIPPGGNLGGLVRSTRRKRPHEEDEALLLALLRR